MSILALILSINFCPIKRRKKIVYIFSDLALFSEMLYKYLEKDEDIVISGISSDPLQVGEIFKILRIDAVILMSCDGNFISNCLKNIRCPLALVIHSEKTKLKTQKNIDLTIDLVNFNQNLTDVVAKLKVFSNHDIRCKTERKLEYHSPITKREKEILLLILKGKKTREIAGELFLSTKTVENHRNNILKKTRAKSMLSLVNELINYGYLKMT